MGVWFLGVQLRQKCSKYQQLSARDLVPVTTCEVAGADLIVSPERRLDQVDELGGIDPKDVAGRLL